MDMSGGGHGSLQPVCWKPNWLRTDSSSSSTGGGGGGTTTTGTEIALSTPTDEMASLLSSKQGELAEAIWNMMEEMSRTRLTVTDDNDGSWRGVQTPEGSSSDIHELTRAMVSYIVLLSTNWATGHQLVDEAAQLRGYVPRFDKVSPLTSLVMETVSCLEEKLAEKSRSFQNQSLRFLFLTNNSYFIWEQLSPTLVLELQRL